MRVSRRGAPARKGNVGQTARPGARGAAEPVVAGCWPARCWPGRSPSAAASAWGHRSWPPPLRPVRRRRRRAPARRRWPDGGPERGDDRHHRRRSVTVGNVSIISGPVPGLFEGAPIGVKAYFAMINCPGWCATAASSSSTPRTTPSAASRTRPRRRRPITNDFALVGSFSLFDGFGCAALASNTAVPDVSVTLDAGTNALPNDFSVQPRARPAGTLGPVAVLQEALPQGQDRRRHRLRRAHRPRHRWPSSSRP